MAKGKLFEYALLYHPKPLKNSDGTTTEQKSTQLNGSVMTVLAGSDQEVSIIAARSIPVEYLDKLEDVEIVIRPF